MPGRAAQLYCAALLQDAGLELTREMKRQQWLVQTLGHSDFLLARASEDASFRSYWRVDVEGITHILMDAPPGQEDVLPWIDIGAALHAIGVHTPQVFAHDAALGFVLMEDLGTRTYLPELTDRTADSLYADALDALLRMQLHAEVADLPHYDRARLTDEMQLMPSWFLDRHLGHALDDSERAALQSAFEWITAEILEQPNCFVHRDFHSRNLLVTDTDNPGVIDFQGAMFGPITYDLVSLLRDCYIEWDDAKLSGWIETYRLKLVAAHLITAEVGAESFQRWFDLTGLQRHIKVLGIFCRLCYRDDKAAYLGDLPLVWRYTIGVARRYPELKDLAELLEHALATRNITTPREMPQS